MNSTFKASLSGIQHDIEGIENQDAVFSGNYSGVEFISLADGAGSLKGAMLCADNIVKQLPAMIADNFDTIISMENSQAAHEVYGYIALFLNELSKNTDMPEDQLGSTFLFAGCHGDHLLIIHLGDGAVLGINANNDCGVLSLPEGSMDGHATYLTCSPDAEKHIRILFLDMSDYREIVLISDGMLSAAFNNFFTPKYNIDTNASYKQLLDKALLELHDDDASYIIMRSGEK